ncbi:substrate-binding domain-containing protein [Curvivirga sp.]|uniref:substrate-binding domain-containing protein n=1 Tax=Curvivirga sp. TaxID=2856848 RepID=UPI003B5B82A2
MRATILLFCFSLLGQVSYAQTLDEYWTLSEYETLYPKQTELGDAFNQVVCNDAEALLVEQQERVKILMVYPGVQVSDYWRRSVRSFEARMLELGVSYRLESYFTKAGTELALQADLLAGSIADEPDVLVFTLDAKRHKDIINRILIRGKTKVVLQNITTPLKDFKEQQPYMYVGFDHLKGTRILADKYLERFPGGAKYAVLYGSRGYVSKLRGDGFISFMSEHEKMEFVGGKYTNFDREKSSIAAMELLSEHPDLDFIYAASTDIAHGITDALKELNMLGKVIVNGWGGGSSEIQAMADGEIDFTVMRMNDDNGVAMAEAVKLLIEGREEEVPLVYSGEIRLLDEAVSAEQIHDMRNFAFRYSDKIAK